MIDPALHTAIRTCTVCGKRFEGGYRALYCNQCRGPANGLKQAANRMRAYQARRADGVHLIDHVCPDCGQGFVAAPPLLRCPVCTYKWNHTPEQQEEQERRKAPAKAGNAVSLAEMCRLSRSTGKSYGALELLSREKPEEFAALRARHGAPK